LERQIVVAFRMPPAGLVPGPEGPYLVRARSMCARGEALGGRLVAWSAALLAMAWDTDSVEEALELATSLREEPSAPERAGTCGVAEGELEALAPDGERMYLAWGAALVSATSLARIAKAGEVLVDGDVRALRAGQLALIGARSATDAGQRVRGWRLDMDRPWKQSPLGPDAAGEPEGGGEPEPEAVGEREVVAEREPVERRGSLGEHEGVAERRAVGEREAAEEPEETIIVSADELEVVQPDRDPTQPMAAVDFDDDELSSSDVLQVIEATTLEPFEEEPSTSARRREGTLADRVRALSQHETNRDPVVAIADLRRARLRAEGGSPSIRCQAALALAMTLSIAGRVEEALLDALDALSAARVAQDPRAIRACIALLAKLYAGAGFPDAARTLRETAESARTGS
jgi:hypothetical protein